MRFLLLYLLYAVALSVGLAIAGLRTRRPGAFAAPGAARKSRQRVLVFGATGATGREVVRQGLERGHRVTAFVRNPAKLTQSHPDLTVITGNVHDRSAVLAAMKEQDAVISVLGHHAYYALGQPQTRATQNILRAVESERVGRFVCQTSLGIGDSAGRLGLLYTLFVIPTVLALYFWDKTGQERAIARSRVDWVIVRPAALINAPARGRWKAGDVGSFLVMARVSRADVASFLLDQLENDCYLRSTPGVCW